MRFPRSKSSRWIGRVHPPGTKAFLHVELLQTQHYDVDVSVLPVRAAEYVRDRVTTCEAPKEGRATHQLDHLRD